MRDLPHVLSLLFNCPHLIEPEKGEVIIDALARRVLDGDGLFQAGERLSAPGESRERRPYAVTDGVAVIHVLGTLVHRSMGLNAWSGLTSYQQLQAETAQALADPDVRAVLFDMDSPGGEAQGTFQFSDWLYERRGAKPMWAAANEKATSAAYAIAAAADRLFVAKTAMVGSIGVLTVHLDRSARDREMGLKYTAIYAGARKNDGDPHASLPKAARAAIQARIDAVYDVFVETVSRYRGLSQDAVRDTEAGIFTGGAALDAGLADEVAPFETVLARLAEEASPSPQTFSYGAESSVPSPGNRNEGENAMSDANKPSGEGAAAQAPNPDPNPAANANDEKVRIAGILDSEEAKGRDVLAKHLAFDTDMSVEDAVKILAAAPKETADAGSGFDAAMAGLGNPEVGADTGGDDDGAGKAALADGLAPSAIYARRAQEAVA